MRKTERERESADQNVLAEFLRDAHEVVGLWRKCATKGCRRWRTCTGDVDECGARHFPEGWAWIRSAWAALCDARRRRDAMRRADRYVIAMDMAADAGHQARTVTIEYPGLGESFEIAAVVWKRGRRSARPARQGTAFFEGKGRRRHNALPGPLAPNLEVGHSRGRANEAIPRRS
jgi:hypothetical protein